MADEPMNRTVTGILDGKRGVQETWGTRGKAVGDSGERHTGCGDLRIARHLLCMLMGRQKTEQYLDEGTQSVKQLLVARMRLTCSGFIGRRVAMGRLSDSERKAKLALCLAFWRLLLFTGWEK